MIRRVFKLKKEFPLSAGIGSRLVFEAEDENPQFDDVQITDFGNLPNLFLSDCINEPEYFEELSSVLRTDDGIDKFIGDDIFVVDITADELITHWLYPLCIKLFDAEFFKNNQNLIIFDDEQNAINYVNRAKKLYSINDISKAYYSIPDSEEGFSFRRLIKELENSQ